MTSSPTNSPPGHTAPLLCHTTLLRTAVDLGRLWRQDLDRLELVTESVLRRDPTLESAIRAHPALATVMARRPPGVPSTGSELETRFLQIIRLIDLPDPVRQHPVCDREGRPIYYLDFWWPEANLWVECDGRATHGTDLAFERDRHRRNEIQRRLPGVRALEFVWNDLGCPLHTARRTREMYELGVAGLLAVSRA